MMKKIVALALCLVLSSGLFSCNADGGDHEHDFDKEVATKEFLKSSADCETPAKYYYSCECGEKGSEVFEYGESAPHEYEKKVLDRYLRT